MRGIKMLMLALFAVFGFAVGLISRSWWSVLIAPALVVAFTLVMTALQTEVQSYGGTEWGAVMTGLLFALWPFVGAVVGIVAGRLIRT